MVTGRAVEKTKSEKRERNINRETEFELSIAILLENRCVDEELGIPLIFCAFLV